MKNMAILIIFCALPAMAAHNGGNGFVASRGSGSARNQVRPANITQVHTGNRDNAGGANAVRCAGFARMNSSRGMFSPRVAGRNANISNQRHGASPISHSGYSAPTAPQQFTSTNNRSVNIAKTTNITNTNINYNNGGWGGWGCCYGFGPIWWYGGAYAGAYVGPGWYYPSAIYPDVPYWNGWAGYEFSLLPGKKTGLQMDLNSISDKETKRYAKKGIVEISNDDAGDNWATIGSVDRLSDHVYPLDPGTYGIKIVFPDKRELDMAVKVRERNVTHAQITFTQPQPTATQPGQAIRPQQPQLVPAGSPLADSSPRIDQ